MLSCMHVHVCVRCRVYYICLYSVHIVVCVLYPCSRWPVCTFTGALLLVYSNTSVWRKYGNPYFEPQV